LSFLPATLQLANQIEGFKNFRAKRENENAELVERLRDDIKGLQFKIKAVKNSDSTKMLALASHENQGSIPGLASLRASSDLKCQVVQLRELLHKEQEANNSLSLHLHTIAQLLTGSSARELQHTYQLNKCIDRLNTTEQHSSSITMQSMLDANTMKNNPSLRLNSSECSPDELSRCKLLIGSLLENNGRLIVLINHLKSQYLLIRKEMEAKKTHERDQLQPLNKKKRAQSARKSYADPKMIRFESFIAPKFTRKIAKEYLKSLHSEFNQHIEEIIAKIFNSGKTLSQMLSSERFKAAVFVQRRSRSLAR